MLFLSPGLFVFSRGVMVVVCVLKERRMSFHEGKLGRMLHCGDEFISSSVGLKKLVSVTHPVDSLERDLFVEDLFHWLVRVDTPMTTMGTVEIGLKNAGFVVESQLACWQLHYYSISY